LVVVFGYFLGKMTGAVAHAASVRRESADNVSYFHKKILKFDVAAHSCPPAEPRKPRLLAPWAQRLAGRSACVAGGSLILPDGHRGGLRPACNAMRSIAGRGCSAFCPDGCVGSASWRTKGLANPLQESLRHQVAPYKIIIIYQPLWWLASLLI